MKQIDSIHQQAVEHTKNKIMEDISKFLGEHESAPDFHQFLEKRSTYISQIWLNVWLTKSTNDFSKRDKKEFLSERGFGVEGVDRKLINKLFRNEMREYEPFNAFSWIENTIDYSTWADMYAKARKSFLKKAEEDRLLEKKAYVRSQIYEAAQDILNDYQEAAYLKIRHETAMNLREIMKENPKYKDIDTFMLEERLTEMGSFDPSEYQTLADFFDELTGQIHQTTHWGRSYFEYETYQYHFEKRVKEYFGQIGTEQVFKNLPIQVISAYKEIHEDELSIAEAKRIINDVLELYIDGYLYKLQEEYISDLIGLAETSFDEHIHQEIYERDLEERERRRAEELAEIERKREEEARMLEDIFGREYNPSLRRNVTYILHIGETNTGKTHHALERMKEAKSGLYLAPLRLLALEVFEKLNSEGVPCSLKTGEEEKPVEGAAHISCTVEMFHEKDFYHVVVIDESQMIADKDRGFSWFKAITKANAEEVHIIGSKNIKSIMMDLLDDSVAEIYEYSREIPLQVESKEFSLNHTKKGDALVCFSRRQVLENASKLQNSGSQVSMIYGSMPPETRKKQMDRFIKGETTVVVATDAIGMGLNLPIRRIVFLENEKFDGTRRRRLTSQEVKQIAGRAGRKGLYNVGKVAFTSEINVMSKLLEKEDKEVETFSIAPTSGIFERFQKYHRSLAIFFELWDKFESPKGTKKASLSEERELYEYVRDTEIEARLPMMELYGFLHLPFSSREPALIEQWLETIKAIVAGTEMPEPVLKTSSLEELELSYKAIGLHLLFLYKLGRKTEAVYWERIRTGLSDDVHEYLKSEVKNYQKKCRHCGKGIHVDSPFQICDACHSARLRNRSEGRDRWR
ncbi:DEAD/DEAH box helicase [Mesobacillus subterraneus]|uniref:DEAD/DEAH box helicase n=1 Tax=Mesobacillus subterraneus TaxID=285983 RepID=UPI00203F6CDE|nr:DEAD/DEAH box helicase [Mesobacillus subterraneus]MCM3664189.1 DEAD/DEAH box helicase [Mesobacillus subterraneus]MCM3682217.1 DEAD/DEAH box helicase [Mesobacillus subterraneus]